MSMTLAQNLVSLKSKATDKALILRRWATKHSQTVPLDVISGLRLPAIMRRTRAPFSPLLPWRRPPAEHVVVKVLQQHVRTTQEAVSKWPGCHRAKRPSGAAP